MAWNKRPIPNYMETVQTVINPISRAQAVDMIIKTAEILQCAPKMLHDAVTNLDRYLSVRDVSMHDLRVAAMTCLKMADGFRVDVHACHFPGGISGYELVRMEHRIRPALDDDFVTLTTAYSFLNSYVCTAQRGRHAPLQGLDCVAAYFADVSLLSTPMLRFSPSMVAAASSVFLAQYILDPNTEKPWSVILRDHTMFEASDLQECVLALHAFLGQDESRLAGITIKYSREETGFAAWKIIPLAIPLHTFDDDADVW